MSLVSVNVIRFTEKKTKEYIEKYLKGAYLTEDGYIAYHVFTSLYSINPACVVYIGLRGVSPPYSDADFYINCVVDESKVDATLKELLSLAKWLGGGRLYEPCAVAIIKALLNSTNRINKLEVEESTEWIGEEYNMVCMGSVKLGR